MKFNKIIVFTILLLQIVCVGNKSKKNQSTEFVLLGADISKRNSDSGVTQASPGANNNPVGSTGGNIWGGATEVINTLTGSGGQTVQINQDMTLVKMKVFDDPVLDAAKKSYLNFIVGYNFIESLFYTPNFTGLEIPPASLLFLEIDKIEIVTDKNEIKLLLPTKKESQVRIYRDKFFFPLISGLVLPVGSYNSIHVYLKTNGKIRILEKEYNLILDTPKLSFDTNFNIEQGKVTTLESQSLKDYEDELRNITREFVRSKFEKNYKPDFQFGTNPNATQRMNLNIVNKSVNIHDSISKLNINFVSLGISDNGSNSFILNGVPSQFEILSLRNGYVGLAASNQIRSGQYEYLELSLARTHFMEVNGIVSQIYMDERSQNIFRFYGPYQMSPTQIFETYFHIDPNRSVYFTKNRGFVFDPTIELLSSISMEQETEETRIIESLGKFMNILASESEYILRGRVTSSNPIEQLNKSGRKLIYSDVVFEVTKVMKGNLEKGNIGFKVVGGELNGIKLEVSSMPKFKAGEELILFMKKNKLGEFVITRGELGKVKL
jgi:hypothetical protein